MGKNKKYIYITEIYNKNILLKKIGVKPNKYVNYLNINPPPPSLSHFLV